MPQSAMKSKLQYYSYRLSTILKSFKTLYTLPSEKVDSFMDSYDIYDHDWVNEEHLIQKMGSDYYDKIKQKIINYYSVLNHLCAIGQVEKMYIPPVMDLSKGVIANQNLFEEKMARDLNLKKGDAFLEIGCGRGRILCHVQKLTGAHGTGINIDHDQLNCAHRYTRSQNLTDVTSFKIADLNDLPLPFADASLDAVYHVQAFTYSKDLEKLCRDIYRILKPGARLACLDWVRLDDYDPKNPEHYDLVRRIKPLIGAIGTPSIDEYTRAIKNAGFEIVENQNASIDGLQAPLIENADRFYTRLSRILRFCVACKILPGHFKVLFDRLTKDGEAFIEADRKRLVTISHYILAQKTLK